MLKPKREINWADGFPLHFRHFLESILDVGLLVESHNLVLFQGVEGDKTKDVDSVFRRAAIVLTCSAWEACIEDMVSGALQFMIDNASSIDVLPKSLKKKLVRSIGQNKHELAPLQLAGDGWRKCLTEVVQDRIGEFHNPTTAKTSALFDDLLGVNVLDWWSWETHVDGTAVPMPAQSVATFVDTIVEARNAIAHGRPADALVHCNVLGHTKNLMTQAAFLTSNQLATISKDTVGQECWNFVRYNLDWSYCMMKE